VKQEPEEFILDVPRPLLAPPENRYHAIEIHSIEYYVSTPVESQAAVRYVSLTTSPRAGQTPFITHCGEPCNLWWFIEHIAAGGVYRRTRDRNKASYTDDLGHGKLLIGEHIYLQLDTVGDLDETIEVQFSIEYTETTVSCYEYAQELSGQLMVG